MNHLIKSIILTKNSIRSIIENNQYLLNVDKKLKKTEIKKLCEELFHTKVISVNTYNLPPKKSYIHMKRAFVKFATIEQNDPLDRFFEFSKLKTRPSNEEENENYLFETLK